MTATMMMSRTGRSCDFYSHAALMLVLVPVYAFSAIHEALCTVYIPPMKYDSSLSAVSKGFVHSEMSTKVSPSAN